MFPKSLLKVLLFGIIFKTTRLLYNQKFYSYKIRKMIDCEYIFAKKSFVSGENFQFIFPRFFHIEHIYLLTWIFFAIEIKKCASTTRSKKLFSTESFLEWKSNLKFPYDANTLRNIILKYIFYIRSCWKQNINDSCQILQTKKHSILK